LTGPQEPPTTDLTIRPTADTRAYLQVVEVNHVPQFQLQGRRLHFGFACACAAGEYDVPASVDNLPKTIPLDHLRSRRRVAVVAVVAIVVVDALEEPLVLVRLLW
jgi:hypothetical protein